MYAMETKQLTKKYGATTAVDHIDLKVKSGSVFGFLGKNGAGKSTLINMITGLNQPTSGSFSLLEGDTETTQDAYRKIGVLPEYSEFYDNMSAMAHLKFFSNILGLSMSREDLMACLRQVGLESAAKLKTKKFSFGMKKKLGIAQAIINQPDILFLDEPTSGVDADAILKIHTLIQEIASRGTTVFLTSHNLDEVEKICDEVAIMSDGNIRIQGSMDELRTQYQNNLTLHVKHNHLSLQKAADLKQKLDPLVSHMASYSSHTEMNIETEAKIPAINRIFFDLDINVYRLEVDKLSLEEIFLHM